MVCSLRTQAEMAHTCRGTINLATAHIDTEDVCNMVLSSGGRTYHLKAGTEVERQKWVTALELAKAKAIRMMNDQSGKIARVRVAVLNCVHGPELRVRVTPAGGGAYLKHGCGLAAPLSELA